MRSSLKTVYVDRKGNPRRSWIYKVDHMSDMQVVAVYRRFQHQGLL